MPGKKLNNRKNYAAREAWQQRKRERNSNNGTSFQAWQNPETGLFLVSGKSNHHEGLVPVRLSI